MNRGIVVSVFLIVACLGAACNSLPLADGGSARGAKAARRPGQSKAAKKAGAAREANPSARAVRLEDASVRESSGVAASRRNPGLYWTHNDSGDGPLIYAFDGDGRKRGVWRVEGASSRDWEDIACGPGPARGAHYLYVGDIGDNKRARDFVTVYRLREPAVAAPDAASTRKSPRATEPAEAIRLKYPDGPRDAEALMVHPKSGDIYIVTKGSVAEVYKLGAAEAAPGEVRTLARVGEFSSGGLFGGLITGGDISPDGRRVALCDYVSGYELRLPDAKADKFDAVWRQEPAPVNLGPREQGEALCYTLDGSSLVATSEGSPASIILVPLPGN
ncbi:MAG TPA: hypothetical protein VD968_11085 [Pyrinomonadaceae bacterium]|nr:hypothetical protein [Pyrinomonadaceae bacterium]